MTLFAPEKILLLESRDEVTSEQKEEWAFQDCIQHGTIALCDKGDHCFTTLLGQWWYQYGSLCQN